MFGRERYALYLSDRETNSRRASSVVVVGRAVSARMRRGRGSEGGAVKCGPTFDRGGCCFYAAMLLGVVALRFHMHIERSDYLMDN
jgi:hypothetical protein